MWKTAEEKVFGWELLESREAGQMKQCAHVTADLVLGQYPKMKVCFQGAYGPHYQRNNGVYRCIGPSSPRS